MQPLRFRQRWTPWWLAAPMLIAYLLLGWLLAHNFDRPDSGVRVAIPPFVLLGALILPAVFNARIITASPEGVRVTNGPFPRGRNVTIARQDIRQCNVREQISDFHSQAGGSTKVANYLAGVETAQGQVDIAYPYLKREEAFEAAGQLAAALNANRLLPAIGVGPARYGPPEDTRWRLRVLGWFGLFIVAAIAGAAWELR